MLKHQWNNNFIVYHLEPFLKRVLIDISRGEKPYLRSLIIKTDPLTKVEYDNFENDYFEGNINDTVTPFTSSDEIEEQEQCITFLHQYIKSFGADPLQRAKAVLPVQDRENKDFYHFSPSVSRNLYVMAYGMAREFEKAEINRLIAEKEKADIAYRKESAAKDRTLNVKGMLMLVKKQGSAYPSKKDSASFHDFLHQHDVRREKIAKAAPFFTPEASERLRENAKKEETSTVNYDALIRQFSGPAAPQVAPLVSASSAPALSGLPSSKATNETIEEAIRETMEEVAATELHTEITSRSQETFGATLQDIGLQLAEPVQMQDGKASVRVFFNETQIQVTLANQQSDPQNPEDDLYIFEFINDPLHRKFVLTREEFEKYFLKDDGTFRDFTEALAMILRDQAGKEPQFSVYAETGKETADQSADGLTASGPVPDETFSPDQSLSRLQEGKDISSGRKDAGRTEGTGPFQIPLKPLKPLGAIPSISNVMASKRKVAAKKRKIATISHGRSRQLPRKSSATPAQPSSPSAVNAGLNTAQPQQNMALPSLKSKQKGKLPPYLAPALVGGSIAAGTLIPIASLLLGHTLKINGLT